MWERYGSGGIVTQIKRMSLRQHFDNYERGQFIIVGVGVGSNRTIWYDIYIYISIFFFFYRLAKTQQQQQVVVAAVEVKQRINNGWKSRENKAGFTGTGGVCTRFRVHGNVRLLRSSKAWWRHDHSHPSRHPHWCHLPRHLRHLWSLYQWNPPWKGTN